jgi:hypothetical protein
VGGTKWNVDQELPLASTRSVSFSSRVNAPLFAASFRFWYENILQFKCTVVGRIPNPSKHTNPRLTPVLSLSRSRKRRCDHFITRTALLYIPVRSGGFWHCTVSYWTGTSDSSKYITFLGTT